MPDPSAEPLVELISRDRAGAALTCPDEGSRLGYDQLADAAARPGVAARARRASDAAVGSPSCSRTGPRSSSSCSPSPRSARRWPRSTPPTREAEYRFYLEDLAPQLLLVGAGAAPAARAAADGLAIVELHADEAGGEPRLEMDGRPLRAAGFEPGRPDDPVLLLHTSGTTVAAEAGAAAPAEPDRPGPVDRDPLRSSRSPTSPTARCRSSTSMAWSPRHLPSSRPAARWSCRAGSAPRRFRPQAAAARR